MILAAVSLFFTVFLHFLPRLTRPGLFFAVTVDPAFRSSPIAARITRLYRFTLWSVVLLTLFLLWLTKRQEVMLLQIAGYYLAMAVAHRRALAYAVEADSALEVDLAAPSESFPGGAIAIAGPVASYGILALWIYRNWSRLPSRFPVHWGWHGPDRWVAKAPAAMAGMLGMELVLSLLFVAVSFGILHWSRRASARGSIASEERRFRRTNVQAFLLLAWLPVAQAWIIILEPASISAWLAGAALLVAAFYYAALIRNRPRLSARTGDHTPNRCWKLGIFYFNPTDPALFVVQRFGIGYTFNFGNRWTWAGLATVFLAVSLRATLR